MVVVPGATAAIKPATLTVTIEESSELNVTGAVMGMPAESITTALSVSVSPGTSGRSGAESCTLAIGSTAHGSPNPQGPVIPFSDSSQADREQSRATTMTRRCICDPEAVGVSIRLSPEDSAQPFAPALRGSGGA